MLKYLKNNYLNLWRYVSLGLLLLGLATFIYADWYWSNACAVEGCSSFFRMAYLAPVREAGLVIAAAVAPFLFLPTHYFKTWLLWIFTPLSVLALYRLSTIDPNSSNMFADTREAFVSGLLLPWLVATAIFIAVYWLKTRKKNTI